jgi:hypothetical protein
VWIGWSHVPDTLCAAYSVKCFIFLYEKHGFYGVFSIVKPMRCTSFTNLFYFVVALYVFRTVFPSIIRSLRLYIQVQHQVYIKHILLAACKWERDGTPDGGRKDHPKHVEWYSINSKIVHLVGFTIKIYLNARPCKHQMGLWVFICLEQYLEWKYCRLLKCPRKKGLLQSGVHISSK